ncbi:hypothetical protein FWK35_00027140 [Aphis craccivora]|uniref:Uncharacterized protein n=1 Tax=Aphis craccivora TaxID=307492 RepID=A0A6G0Y2Q2_APHCR|nr:hypothetical protein FWK35_00027140 [Aphis craccivora]
MKMVCTNLLLIDNGKFQDTNVPTRYINVYQDIQNISLKSLLWFQGKAIFLMHNRKSNIQLTWF